MDTSTSSNYKNSFDHVTTRRPKQNHNISSFSISGERAIFNSTVLNGSLSTSCPNLMEKSLDITLVTELKERVLQLETELSSANNEISEMMIQNSELIKSKEQ